MYMKRFVTFAISSLIQSPIPNWVKKLPCLTSGLRTDVINAIPENCTFLSVIQQGIDTMDVIECEMDEFF